MMDADEFERAVSGFRLHPKAERGLSNLRRIHCQTPGPVPHEGESFQLHGYHVEVIDMDNHRVDKVLMMPLPIPGSGALSGLKAK
jgi:putative hemolysin